MPFVKNVGPFSQTANQQAMVITVGATIAAGNLLSVVAIRGNGTSDALATVTDSKGNTYTVDKNDVFPGNENLAVASSVLATGLGVGDTITMTWTNAAANNFWSSLLSEYSGIATASWADKAAAATAFAAQATDAITSGATATTTQASELVFGMITTENTGDVLTAGTGFTLRTQYADANMGIKVGVEDMDVTSTGAQTATGTWPTGNRRESAICVTYKAAAGGGGSRGLFQPPPLTGVGQGGSGYFSNPLAAPIQMVRRDRIFVPARLKVAA